MKRTAYAAFLLLGVIWGSNFIFVKWAVSSITPGQIVLWRVIFGFLPVFGYALATRALRLAHLRYSHHFLAMALLATAIYYLAFAQGTALLLSSVAGMLSGAIPLFTFACAWLLLREEPLSRRSALGVALGFLGVLLIARPWSGADQVNLDGALYMAAGSLSVGCSFVYARKFISPLQLPAAALTTYQMGFATLALLLVTEFEGMAAVFSDTRAWIGLVFGLGLLGTGLAYIIYYFIVAKLGAVAASSVTYIPPLVAMAIGVLGVGERLDGRDLLAMALILAGVAILQRARPRRPQAAPE
ncbi:DMT family transporter [Pseudomonas sp. RIT-PI-AD]|uniref:DMT family transporter n=1 Tax=Pseudomonas sp. RIT-PI-AD TaxID=3035294 RepID=UPI0021D97743|nr:DMT family transporter [Pseudomonas sp. RIT-PI-AD]